MSLYPNAIDAFDRLAVTVFKIDTYIAILTCQPPLLRLKEIRLSSASTFALWNARDLPVWEVRKELEPSGRTKITIPQMLSHLLEAPIDNDSSSVIFLPEDAQIGFLSMFSEIWHLGEDGEYISENLNPIISQKEHLNNQLLTLKRRLDGMLSSGS